MNELEIKNKIIKLFPEAHRFITGSVDILVVVLSEYSVDFNFRYNKNDSANDKFIRFKVEIKGWKVAGFNF